MSYVATRACVEAPARILLGHHAMPGLRTATVLRQGAAAITSGWAQRGQWGEGGYTHSRNPPSQIEVLYPRSGRFPSGLIGAPLSDVNNTKVLSARPLAGSRTVDMTCPTAQSISSTASPIGPRFDLPQNAAPHELGA